MKLSSVQRRRLLSEEDVNVNDNDISFLWHDLQDAMENLGNSMHDKIQLKVALKDLMQLTLQFASKLEKSEQAETIGHAQMPGELGQGPSLQPDEELPPSEWPTRQLKRPSFK